MSGEPLETSRGRRILRFLAAGLYLILATALLVVFRLPVDRVLGSVAAKVERQGGPVLQFGTASLGWNGSVHLDGLRAELKQGRLVVPVELGRTRVQPGWSSSLLGKPAASVQTEAYGGKIEVHGRAADLRGSRLMGGTLQVDGVDLSQANALAVLTGGTVQGLVDVRAEAELPGAEPAEWSGTGRLEVSGLDLRNVGLGGLTLEHLPLGRATIELELPKGSGEVRILRCQVSGSDLELEGTGRLVLAADLPRSRLEVQLRFQLAGPTKELLGDAVMLMGYKPDENGWIRMSVEGSLQSARVSPAS